MLRFVSVLRCFLVMAGCGVVLPQLTIAGDWLIDPSGFKANVEVIDADRRLFSLWFLVHTLQLDPPADELDIGRSGLNSVFDRHRVEVLKSAGDPRPHATFTCHR